ncbi:MAG: hypothetical protein KDK76_05565 [Chlamydiia bacterium]|nr:hypothetical protein [Chlamydiia bacterium]
MMADQLGPVPYSQRWGNGGWKDLNGWLSCGLLDILDQVGTVGDVIGHIDQDAPPLLQLAIKNIENLLAVYGSEASLDRWDLIKPIIQDLKKIEEMTDREPLVDFYFADVTKLHIISDTSGSDQKKQSEHNREIEVERSKASEFCQGYQKRVATVRELLEKFTPTSQVKPTAQETLKELKELLSIFQEAARRSRSPAAKVVHMGYEIIASNLKDLYDEKVGKKGPSEVEKAKHPLLQLLIVIGQNRQCYRPYQDRAGAISKALSALEKYGAQYQGIQDFVHERVPKPYRDLDLLTKTIHRFLMRPIQLPAYLPIQTDETLKSLYDTARKKGVGGAPPPGIKRYEELQILPQNVPNFEQKGAIEGQIKLEKEALQYYDGQAYNDEAPLQTVPDAEKIAWALGKQGKQNIQDIEKTIKKLQIEWAKHFADHQEQLPEDPELRDILEDYRLQKEHQKKQQELIGNNNVQGRLGVRLGFLAKGQIKPEQVLLDDYIALYNFALERGVAPADGPSGKAENRYKIEWGIKLLQGAASLSGENEEVQGMIKWMREDHLMRVLSTMVYVNAKERKFEGFPKETSKEECVQWGYRQIQSCTPYSKDNTKICEIIWKSIAQYELLEEIYRLQGKLTPQDHENLSGLVKNIDLAIQIFERDPTLFQKAGGALKIGAHEVYDWISLAHQSLRKQTPSTLEQETLDRKLEEIYIHLRKGAENNNYQEYLHALIKIKNYIEKSALGATLLPQEEVKSPSERLQSIQSEFTKTKPPSKAPDVRQEVLKKLGVDEQTPWESRFLKEAIEKQRREMIQNTSVLAGYNIAKEMIGEMRQTYKQYVDAIEAIAGEGRDYDVERIEQALQGLGFDTNNEHGRALVEIVKAPIREARAHHAHNLNTEEAQEALHEATYQVLLRVLIETNSDDHPYWGMLAGWFLPTLLWIINLCSEPISKTLIETYYQDVVVKSDGRLTNNHLIPVQGLNQGLASYNGQTRAMARILKRNEDRDLTVPEELRNLSYNKEDALEKLLETSNSYGGLPPSEVDQQTVYLAIKHLKVANWTSHLDEMFDIVQMNVNSDAFPSLPDFINTICRVIKKILSVIPYTLLYTEYALLKMAEGLVNFSMQMGAKFTIWATDGGTQILESSIDALINSSGHTTELDTLILEKLRELRDNLKNGAHTEEEVRENDTLDNEPIRAFIENLIHTITLVQEHTREGIEERERNRITLLDQANRIGMRKVQDLLTPILIGTAESFLNEESMLEMLYRGLKIANDGMQEKGQLLKEEQMIALQQALGHPPTHAEILHKAQELHKDLKHQISSILSEILENQVNPVVNKGIDQIQKPPADITLEYIYFLEERLYSTSGNKSLIHFLETHLGEEEIQDETLTTLYSQTVQFMQELREHQTLLDGHSSYNGFKLNQLFNEQLLAPLNELSVRLSRLIGGEETLRMKKIPIFEWKLQKALDAGRPQYLAEELRTLMGEQEGVEPLATLLANYQQGQRGNIEEQFRGLKERSKQAQVGVRNQASQQLTTLKEALNGASLREIRESVERLERERHSGVKGMAVSFFEKLVSATKEQAKGPVNKLINDVVTGAATEATDLYKKKSFVKHIIRTEARQLIQV